MERTNVNGSPHNAALDRDYSSNNLYLLLRANMEHPKYSHNGRVLLPLSKNEWHKYIVVSNGWVFLPCPARRMDYKIIVENYAKPHLSSMPWSWYYTRSFVMRRANDVWCAAGVESMAALGDSLPHEWIPDVRCCLHSNEPDPRTILPALWELFFHHHHHRPSCEWDDESPDGNVVCSVCVSCAFNGAFI